jgi:hypothetical protein
MQIRKPIAANYGVSLDPSELPDEGFELRTNSDTLARIALGRDAEGHPIDNVEGYQPGQQQPVVPPWNRPIPEPSLAIDFSGLIVPAAILGACILAAVLIRVFVK